MAIKRQKLNRKVDLVMDGDNVVDMPPGWQFTVECPHHGKVVFNLEPFRANGREELAGHIRDALWSLRHEMAGTTLEQMPGGVQFLYRFLDELHAAGESITRLAQIDRKLLDRYLAWLELQVSAKGPKKGQRLSIATRRGAFVRLKALLKNRQTRCPGATSPDLTFPRNPFPNANRISQPREAYSASEQKRITEALNVDLKAIHEGVGATPTPLQVLVVHLLLLALATGRNKQSLLDLRRDSLRDHPLGDRDLLVTTKRRGWSTQASGVRRAAESPTDTKDVQAIPASIGDHIRFLSTFTADLAGEAEVKDSQFIFLCRITRMDRKGQVVRLDAENAKQAVATFCRRHSLLGDNGEPLSLNVARLRPTFATELYRRTRDIRRVSQALGHASVETTARHYVATPPEALRDHALVMSAMVGTFTRHEVDGKLLVAADGAIPLRDMKDLLTSGYSTGIARCQNPFRDGDSVCKKFFACFKCPSMCIFEDDLWRLFSFYYRLLAERAKINAAQWMKTYGPIIRRIDADIASQFPADKVEAARRKAQQEPHPTWKGPLL